MVSVAIEVIASVGPSAASAASAASVASAASAASAATAASVAVVTDAGGVVASDEVGGGSAVTT